MSSDDQKKYKGVRRRKWGKWVSEIRVPGTQERLWLGSYSAPEAAAVAHDVAFYCLRRPAAESAALDRINFPMMVPVGSLSKDMSPRSVQRAASDAGMGVDAQMIIANKPQENHGNGVEGSSGAHGGFEAEVWEDKYDQSCGSSGGVGGGCRTWREEKELSISVDDYLS
ncbi:hypothetical protein ACOSQ4_009307 [Xanthoceras sorbifolium]